MTILVKLKIFVVLVGMMSCCLTFSQTTYAEAGFGCSGVAGSVIFRDTFYGLLTGGVIGTMVVLTSSDKKFADGGPTIASGAMIGSVAGLGLGVAEIMLRDCHEPARREGTSLEHPHSPRFVIAPTIAPTSSWYGLTAALMW